jgi:hypothetical protein
MPGPMRNRSDDLSRERDAKRGDRMPISKGTLRPVTDVPGPDPDWHPIAQELYLSAAESGQSDFYQKSDWMLWFSLCEDLSYYKTMGKRSGQMLQTIYSTMTELLVSEGARRKVSIELHEPEPEEDDAAVLALADYRQALDLDDEEDPA